MRRYFVRTALVTVAVVSLVLALEPQFLCGDTDGSGDLNVADVTYLVAFLFQGGPAPTPWEAADCDLSGEINVADLTYLVSYLFQAGPAPCNLVQGTLVDHTGCKSYVVLRDSITNDQDCIQYLYDGVGALTLKHINAGFNCCPGSLHADFDIGGGLITITESEVYDTVGPCACLCLFDVDYEISGLPPGLYTIRVNGLYVNPGDDPLEFPVDLSGPVDTSYFCVQRDYYPWGEY
jgi:hypothetical protein